MQEENSKKDLNSINKSYLTLNNTKMVLKTFNVEESVYKKFSEFCKGHGVSMSKQVEMFINSFIDEDPKAKQEYLQKLDRIRSGKFIKVDSFSKKYGL